MYMIAVCQLDSEASAKVSADMILRHTTKTIILCHYCEKPCDAMRDAERIHVYDCEADADDCQELHMRNKKDDT